MWLLIAFIAVPLIEIYLFIQVGTAIGVWPTLGIVLATAILGTYMLRLQGTRAMENLRGSFSTLQNPAEPLAHGAMILFSGALLLTPGFFTDALGFALLLPPVRDAVIKYARARINIQSFDMGPDQHKGQHMGQPPRARPRSDPNDHVVEAEYEDVTPEKQPTHGPSGWTRH